MTRLRSTARHTSRHDEPVFLWQLQIDARRIAARHGYGHHTVATSEHGDQRRGEDGDQRRGECDDDDHDDEHDEEDVDDDDVRPNLASAVRGPTWSRRQRDSLAPVFFFHRPCPTPARPRPRRPRRPQVCTKTPSIHTSSGSSKNSAAPAWASSPSRSPGTSLRKWWPRRPVDDDDGRYRRSHIDRHKVAVVCSARSGSTKQLGTTNLLLRAASQVRQRRPPTPVSNDLFRRSRSSSSPRSASPPVGPLTPLTLTPTPTPAPAAIPPPEFAPTVDLIRAEHIKAARQTIQDPALLAELEDEIERDCEWLTSYLLAAQVIDEISPRSKDNIIGFGERLACKLVTAVLRDQGVDAEYVSLEDILPLVDDVVGQGCCLDQAFFDTVAHAAADRVRLCAPRIPVLTGPSPSPLFPLLLHPT